MVRLSNFLIGLMKFLAKGRTDRIVEDAEEQLKRLLATFRHHLKNKYNSYALYFFFCEVLNFLVMVGQVKETGIFSFMANNIVYALVFLDEQVSPRPIHFLRVERLSVLDVARRGEELSPRTHQSHVRGLPQGGQLHLLAIRHWREANGYKNRCCRFCLYRISSTKGVSAICILALNIIIDKIYVILWFWFVLVMFLGGFRIVCRVFQVAFPRVRYILMKFKMGR